MENIFVSTLIEAAINKFMYRKVMAQMLREFLLAKVYMGLQFGLLEEI